MEKGRIPLNRGKSVSFLDVTSQNLSQVSAKSVSRSAENNAAAAFSWNSKTPTLEEEETDENEDSKQSQSVHLRKKPLKMLQVDGHQSTDDDDVVNKKRNNIYQRSRSAVSLLISELKYK